MNYKKLIALPILGLAFSSMGYASTNLISSISSLNSTPLDVDYVFNNRGLSGNVAAVPNGYALTLNGGGNINFFQNSSSSSVSRDNCSNNYTRRRLRINILIMFWSV